RRHQRRQITTVFRQKPVEPEIVGEGAETNIKTFRRHALGQFLHRRWFLLVERQGRPDGGGRQRLIRGGSASSRCVKRRLPHLPANRLAPERALQRPQRFIIRRFSRQIRWRKP